MDGDIQYTAKKIDNNDNVVAVYVEFHLMSVKERKLIGREAKVSG